MNRLEPIKHFHNMSLLSKLDQLPAFHHAVRLLKLRELAGCFLHHFPTVRSLPKTNTRYRCRQIETLLLSDEMFNRNVYLKAIDSAHIKTFADLGCNVGLFAILLADLTQRKDLMGLMIDANPEMIEEPQWHLTENRLDRIKPVFGLVGSKNKEDKADFYLLPSNLGSSQFNVYEPGKPPKGKWKKISVPCVELETIWMENYGNIPCDILKIDIEGSELNFLKTETAFLQRVSGIILEWHKWIVSLEAVAAELNAQGFFLVEVLEEQSQTGIAWFKRR